MADILKFIFEIINNTPFWVWVVLIILIKRGTSLINDSPASIGRSIIMPFIFVIWGLNTVVNKFASPNTLLSFYLVALILGFLFSYLLYMRRSFYVEDGQLIQEGSALPCS
ncbi:CcdC protein domain-containing protein [Leuconostoc mesenteroides]